MEQPDKPKAVSLVLNAFRGAQGLTRKPRSPEKAAWLREQGIDPDRPFASWDLAEVKAES
jgi:hypothetical protein